MFFMGIGAYREGEQDEEEGPHPIVRSEIFHKAPGSDFGDRFVA